ncbi:hypothetical protein JOM56_005335, partial [Amanita muscaria]
AYNIRVVFQDAPTFFRSPTPPLPFISPEALNTQDASDAHDEDVYALLRTLDLAMSPSPSGESAVDDFVRRAITDVSIVGDTDILLIVEENQTISDIEPQLLAKAIVAFSANDITRAGLPPFDSKIMPGIIMKGTSPISYKVHVATALGKYPEVETIVYARFQDLRRWSEGMKPLDNRRLLLSRCEAFRHVL